MIGEMIGVCRQCSESRKIRTVGGEREGPRKLLCVTQTAYSVVLNILSRTAMSQQPRGYKNVFFSFFFSFLKPEMNTYKQLIKKKFRMPGGCCFGTK